MMQKTVGLLSILAILAASTGAMAQMNSESNSTSGSQSNATSRGGNSNVRTSQGNSQGVTSNTNTGVTVDQRSYGTPYTSGYIGYGGGTNNSSTERSTGDVTIRTTPQVYAPPVSAGNPCSLAYSAGVSVIGWGAAAGGTVVDQDCADRQRIAMTWNAGFKSAAKELMCNDQKTYAAFKSVGEPCTFRAQFEAPGTAPTPVRVAPTPITPPQGDIPPAPVAAKEYVKCNPRAGIVDNCRS